MGSNIIPLKEIGTLSQSEATALFPYPHSYIHTGATITKVPKWIEFNKVRVLDSYRNIGRPEDHSQEELQLLQNSFSGGVQTWQELPMVAENNESEIQQFDYNQVLGFGRVHALEANGQTGHWFHIIKGSPYQLSWVATIENLEDLLSPKVTTGEKGLIHQLSNLIVQGRVLNTEDAIEDELETMVPGLSKISKGRIKSVIYANHAVATRYTTWGPIKIKQWMRENASIHFEMSGKYDSERNMNGYAAKNPLDPWHNACMEYAKTGTKSYVVFHVNRPDKNTTLKQKRENLLGRLNLIKNSYKQLGLTTDPLTVLGFMYQDNDKEIKKFLVDRYGKAIK